MPSLFCSISNLLLRSLVFTIPFSVSACGLDRINQKPAFTTAHADHRAPVISSAAPVRQTSPEPEIFPSLNYAALHPDSALECVLLVHGLSRSGNSMGKMREALGAHGYLAFTLDYPSTKYSIEALSLSILPAGITACREQGASTIHLVTHSMGGIVARYFLKHNDVPGFGRLVMLAPPNQGSELIDFYRSVPGFKKLLGPAASQLGTDPENSLPLKLGPVTVDTAIITGSESSNSLMSLTLPGPDDGKVTAASTLVEGMCAQVSLPTSHRMIMKDDVSVHEVVHYITHGRFHSRKAVYKACGSNSSAAT